MWRLDRLLRPVWAFFVVIVTVGFLLNMASNCAYDALLSQGCQITIEDIWELPKAPILVVVLTLLLVGVLRLVSGRSRRRYEAGKASALIKPVEKPSPKNGSRLPSATARRARRYPHALFPHR